MNLPRFTAELSLQRSTGRYARTPSDHSSRSGAVIEPQGCGPCFNGLRQCSGGLACDEVYIDGFFDHWQCYPQYWSEPCRHPLLAPPPD
jgi:hypothetical protein